MEEKKETVLYLPFTSLRGKREPDIKPLTRKRRNSGSSA